MKDEANENDFFFSFFQSYKIVNNFLVESYIFIIFAYYILLTSVILYNVIYIIINDLKIRRT